MMTTMTANEKAIGSRLAIFRKNHIKTIQEDLAKELGTTVKTLSLMENGHAQPSPKVITELSRRYRLNSDWLMTGKGEPISSGKPDQKTAANTHARILLLERKVQELQDTLNEVLKKLQ